MILAVEIGGTKLQSALVDEQGQVSRPQRDIIDRAAGAAGILDRLQGQLAALADQPWRCIGVGFGGPVSADGVIYRSHQVAGWDRFDLAGWFERQTGRRAVVANDCDAAAMGEALWGAGRGVGSMFYVTVGTGVGGGWVVGDRRQGADRPAVAEIGHLRPGLDCTDSHATVESLASGGGMAERYKRIARAWFGGADDREQDGESPGIPLPAKPVGASPTAWSAAEQFYREHGLRADFDTRAIADAASRGDLLARLVFDQATRTLGWAIAQVATITAAERFVIGGGVAKQSDELFWEPVRAAFREYAFGPLRETTQLVPSALGDDVVLVGAAAVAEREAASTTIDATGPRQVT